MRALEKTYMLIEVLFLLSKTLCRNLTERSTLDLLKHDKNRTKM